jgi:hypothetical protein
VSLMCERIESLAPDQASLAAVLKLDHAVAVLVASADRGLLWGRIPRLWRALLIVSLHDVGYKCVQARPRRAVASR